MIRQKFELARQYALGRLQSELSSSLLYHGLGHTRDDVVPAVEILAGLEGIQGNDFYLLLTSAWFHDLGYVEQPPYHEMISARMAAAVLPDFGYSNRQIEIVRWAIYATIIPQSPETHLEEILADADLSVLGHDDFMVHNNNLRRERALFGKVYTDSEWYVGQLNFLEKHKYFTASARAQYNAQKLANIDIFKAAFRPLV